MSSISRKFRLSALSLRSIKSVSSKDDCTFVICGQEFFLNRMLVPFLSPFAYKKFLENNAPFTIDLPEIEFTDPLYRSLDTKSVICGFRILMSLLEGDKQPIKIDHLTAVALHLISISLHNFPLAKSLKISQEQPNQTIGISSSFLASSDFSSLPKDFSFIVCDTCFSCPRPLAFYLSPKACDQFTHDKTSESFSLSKPSETSDSEFSTIFSHVFGLLIGQTLEITTQSASTIANIARQLDNEELIAASSAILCSTDQIAVDDTIACLKSLTTNVQTADLTLIASFAASHFFELDARLLCYVDVPIIDMILRSSTLKLIDEASLLEFIGFCIHAQNDSAISLLSRVQLQFIDVKTIGEFLQLLSPEKIGSDIWQNVCARLKVETSVLPTAEDCKRWVSQQRMEAPSPDSPFEIIPMLEGEKPKKPILKKFPAPLNAHNGIFAFLRGENYGANPHQAGLICISASSVWLSGEEPYKVAEWDSNSYWFSQNLPGQWIQFDFKDCTFTLTEFDVLPRYNGFPRSWKVEGSLGGNKWEEIHKANEDLRFNAENHQGSAIRVKCSKSINSRLVRITALDKNFNPNDCFFFCAIDFYGVLTAPVDSQIGQILMVNNISDGAEASENGDEV